MSIRPLEPITRWLRANFETCDGSRMTSMEGLRGLAVLLVFAHHYATQALLLHPSGLTAQVAEAAKRYGNLGVELFFVLSGYLIYGLLVSKKTGFLRFMSRRVVRIYPAFVVAFAFAFAMEVPSLADAGVADVAGTIVANLLLLPGILPGEPILRVAWSLSYEFFFYFATALLVAVAGLRRCGASARMTVLLTLTAVFCLLSLAETPHIPVRMLPFFAGMLLFETQRVSARAVHSSAALAAPAVAFAVGEMMPLLPLVRELIHTTAFFLLCAACFAGTGMAAKALSWAPLRWLGNMSYSYYLMHGFAVTAGARALGAAVSTDGSQVWFWVVAPLLFVASLVPSALLYLFVEKPISLQSVRRVQSSSVAVETGVSLAKAA